MNRVILLLVIGLTACGNMNPTPEQPAVYSGPLVVSEEIVPFYEDFLSTCGDKWGADLSRLPRLRSLQFGEPPGTYVGVCHTQWDSINKNYIVHMDIVVERPIVFDYQFRALVYHELAHCVLGRGHTAQEEDSIMKPALESADYYWLNWDNLERELCTGGRGK